MGNDGGSIPKRRELVKEAARVQSASEIKESQREAQTYAWRTCPLSQKPLEAPIVSDCLGTLYNKDAVLEYLLPSDDAEERLAKADAEKVLSSRVKGLKDIVEVKFQSEQDSKYGTSTKWVCPLSDKPLSPAVKTAYIVPCGHVFAEVALREVAELVCLQCNEPYSTDNIVTILPAKDADKARLQQRIEDLRAKGLSHSLKKASSKRKHKNAESAEASTKITAKDTEGKVHIGNGATNGIKNASTASLTAKVLAEEEAKAKRRKLGANDNFKSLFSGGERKPMKDGDFMTRGYSIPAGAKR